MSRGPSLACRPRFRAFCNGGAVAAYVDSPRSTSRFGGRALDTTLTRLVEGVFERQRLNFVTFVGMRGHTTGSKNYLVKKIVMIVMECQQRDRLEHSGSCLANMDILQIKFELKSYIQKSYSQNQATLKGIEPRQTNVTHFLCKQAESESSSTWTTTSPCLLLRTSVLQRGCISHFTPLRINKELGC